MIYREKVFHATNGNVAQLIYKQKKEKKYISLFPKGDNLLEIFIKFTKKKQLKIGVN